MRWKVFILISIISISCSQEQEADPINLESFRLSDEELSEFISPFKVDGKWGLINALGKVVIPAEYDFKPDWFIHDKVILEKDRKKAIYSLNNEVLIPFLEGDINYVKGYTKDDSFFYITKYSPQEYIYLNLDLDTIPFQYGYELRNTFRPEPAPINTHRSNGPVDFTVVNLKGKELLSFTNTEMVCWVGPFNEGMAPFFITKFNYLHPSSQDKLYYGYINENGEMAIPVQFELLDADHAYSSDFERSNFIRFENGMALVNTGEERYFIDKKGKRIHTLKNDEYQVFSPFESGSRLIEERLYDQDFDLLFEPEDRNWNYGLHIPSKPLFTPSGYCIQFNDKSKEFRIVDSKMNISFKHTLVDEDYVYDLHPSFVSGHHWLMRASKDSLNGPMTGHHTGVSPIYGERRLVTEEGKYVTNWIRDPYIYNLSLGMKCRWVEPKDVRKSELRTLNGELLFSCENCEVNIDWNYLQNRHRGVSAILKEKGEEMNIQYLTAKGDLLSMAVDNNLSFRHKDQYNYLDARFYENPDFQLQFDEDDVFSWYNELLQKESDK